MSTPNAMGDRASRVKREDLVMFINACFACTRQNEFYGDSRGQAVSLLFLHDYILGNYRRLYARCLSAGINHLNRAEIVMRLLGSGADTPPDFRGEEGELIRSALRSLPPPRVLRLFAALRRSRINNRRTRATIRDYLAWRPDRSFDAVKYRRKVSLAAAHAHLRLDEETGAFLFEPLRSAYETPLYDRYRSAHYSKSAIYDLPYTIAEGLAAKHGVRRAEFMKKIEPRLTQNERLRLQSASQRATGKRLAIDLGRSPLTKLALYLLSEPEEERRARQAEFDSALDRAAERAIGPRYGTGGGQGAAALGRVACVLDRSYSASGSREKRRRPLAIALAASRIVRALSTDSRDFWSTPPPDGEGLFVSARGQTRLAEPLLDALEWRPDLVIIVSDGFENDPPGAVEAVISGFRAHLDPEGRVSFVHVNPVFDAETFEPMTLGPSIPTVGVRGAEDLPTMLAFARFVDGASGLDELEGYLSSLANQFISGRRKDEVPS